MKLLAFYSFTFNLIKIVKPFVPGNYPSVDKNFQLGINGVGVKPNHHGGENGVSDTAMGISAKKGSVEGKRTDTNPQNKHPSTFDFCTRFAATHRFPICQLQPTDKGAEIGKGGFGSVYELSRSVKCFGNDSGQYRFVIKTFAISSKCTTAVQTYNQSASNNPTPEKAKKSSHTLRTCKITKASIVNTLKNFDAITESHLVETLRVAAASDLQILLDPRNRKALGMVNMATYLTKELSNFETFIRPSDNSDTQTCNESYLRRALTANSMYKLSVPLGIGYTRGEDEIVGLIFLRRTADMTVSASDNPSLLMRQSHFRWKYVLFQTREYRLTALLKMIKPLVHLAYHGMVHLDIKNGNYLLDIPLSADELVDDERIKRASTSTDIVLGDLGISSLIGKKSTGGTPFFMAPEMSCRMDGKGQCDFPFSTPGDAQLAPLSSSLDANSLGKTAFVTFCNARIFRHDYLFAETFVNPWEISTKSPDQFEYENICKTYAAISTNGAITRALTRVIPFEQTTLMRYYLSPDPIYRPTLQFGYSILMASVHLWRKKLYKDNEAQMDPSSSLLANFYAKLLGRDFSKFSVNRKISFFERLVHREHLFLIVKKCPMFQKYGANPTLQDLIGESKSFVDVPNEVVTSCKEWIPTTYSSEIDKKLAENNEKARQKLQNDVLGIENDVTFTKILKYAMIKLLNGHVNAQIAELITQAFENHTIKLHMPPPLLPKHVLERIKSNLNYACPQGKTQSARYCHDSLNSAQNDIYAMWTKIYLLLYYTYTHKKLVKDPPPEDASILRLMKHQFFLKKYFNQIVYSLNKIFNAAIIIRIIALVYKNYEPEDVLRKRIVTTTLTSWPHILAIGGSTCEKVKLTEMYDFAVKFFYKNDITYISWRWGTEEVKEIQVYFPKLKRSNRFRAHVARAALVAYVNHCLLKGQQYQQSMLSQIGDSLKNLYGSDQFYAMTHMSIAQFLTAYQTFWPQPPRELSTPQSYIVPPATQSQPRQTPHSGTTQHRLPTAAPGNIIPYPMKPSHQNVQGTNRSNVTPAPTSPINVLVRTSPQIMSSPATPVRKMEPSLDKSPKSV